MKNLRSHKLHLQVYDETKSYIEKNHLVSGDKLPSEMKMRKILEVNRNALREAIKSLEITGTACSTPDVGIVIQELNIDLLLSNLIYSISDEDQLHKETEELHRVLELGFVKDAYESTTPESLESPTKETRTMENLFVQIKQSRSSVYGVRFAKANASFYKVLFQTVDNHLLRSIIELFQTCDRYYKVKTIYSNMELTVERHLCTYNAIKVRDYQGYYGAMQFHSNIEYFKR